MASPLTYIGEETFSDINENRLPNRPLGEFSDFVVNELPDIAGGLESLSPSEVKNICERIKSLVENIPNNPSEIRAADRRLALLDMVMVETVISNFPDIFKDNVSVSSEFLSSIEVPVSLTRKTEFLATLMGRVPSITYQSVILDNNPNDPRVFSTGETAEHEWFFYRTHFNIEKKNINLINSLLRITSPCELNEENLENIRFQLGEIRASISSIRNLLHHFSKEEFDKFRPFFYGNKERKMPGASGLYSATLSVMDILLAEDLNLLSNVREGGALLMPTRTSIQNTYADQEHISEALRFRNEHGTLVSLAISRRREDFLMIFKEILEEILTFRKRHLGSVQRFIPEVSEGEATGTANPEGQSSIDILMNLIQSTEDSIDMINEYLDQN